MNKIKNIIQKTKNLPYFTLDDLSCLEKNHHYLKVLLSRYYKKGDIKKLKKGIYVNLEYIDKIKKNNLFSDYLEFISNVIYPSSYLSLDYVLYEYNIITEIPQNYTLVSINKTSNISNDFGNFIYHKIKDNLFCGFDLIKKNNFNILKATKVKALFDFLYFRKNILNDITQIEELRLNLESFTKKEKKEIEEYIILAKNKKMIKIFKTLWKI